MKVFIAVDLEGVAGYVRWDPADRDRERRFITAEANAAVAGAFDGGATDVLVTEAHANMRNIIPEAVDGRAVFLSGEPKPLNHVAGIDASFDAAMFVGYHAKAGTANAIMCHTYNLHVFSLKLNGLEVGELGADAAVAGHFGVPTVMVSGDKAACEEAKSLAPDVETVCVKDGIGYHAAKCIHPERAYELIRIGAKTALERRDSIKPFAIEPPVRAEVTFTHPNHVDAVAALPFVERLDGRTIAFDAPNAEDAFRLFDGLHFLAKGG